MQELNKTALKALTKNELIEIIAQFHGLYCKISCNKCNHTFPVRVYRDRIVYVVPEEIKQKLKQIKKNNRRKKRRKKRGKPWKSTKYP